MKTQLRQITAKMQHPSLVTRTIEPNVTIFSASEVRVVSEYNEGFLPKLIRPHTLQWIYKRDLGSARHAAGCWVCMAYRCQLLQSLGCGRYTQLISQAFPSFFLGFQFHNPHYRSFWINNSLHEYQAHFGHARLASAKYPMRVFHLTVSAIYSKLICTCVERWWAGAREQGPINLQSLPPSSSVLNWHLHTLHALL